MQDRIRDHAILQTLGYTGYRIAQLIVTESTLLSMTGGVIGAVAAIVVVTRSRLSMTMEGMNIEIVPDPIVMAIGSGVSIVLGALAGLVPAWRASRREIASCFRAV